MTLRTALIALSTCIMLAACGGEDPANDGQPATDNDYTYDTGNYGGDDIGGSGQPGTGEPWNECMNADCNMPDMPSDDMVTIPPPWEAPNPTEITKHITKPVAR